MNTHQILAVEFVGSKNEEQLTATCDKQSVELI